MKEDVSKEMVEHVASLAMLRISDDQKSEYQENLAKILGHIKDLEKVDTQGVEPLANPMRAEIFEEVRWREDEVRPSLSPVELLRNAPDSGANQFKVEAVLEAE